MSGSNVTINMTSLFISIRYKQIFCITIDTNVNIKMFSFKMLLVMVVNHVIRLISELRSVTSKRILIHSFRTLETYEYEFGFSIKLYKEMLEVFTNVHENH